MIVPLVVTFVNVKSFTEGVTEFSLIVGALAALWVITSTRVFTGLVDRSIKFALKRAAAFRQELDHQVLLRLDAGFSVSEVALAPGHKLVGATLARSALADHGVVVLGITRADGRYVGAPRGDTPCEAGDVLTVYGRDQDVRVLASDFDERSRKVFVTP